MATNPKQTAVTASRPTIQVKAAPGLKVPMMGTTRRYITDAEVVPVPRNAYYMRRLKDKDLVHVTTTDAVATAVAPASARAPGVVSEA